MALVVFSFLLVATRRIRTVAEEDKKITHKHKDFRNKLFIKTKRFIV
jgi:hypothetical protein